MSDLWENAEYDKPPKRPACAFGCGLIVCDHPDLYLTAPLPSLPSFGLIKKPVEVVVVGPTAAMGDALRLAMYREMTYGVIPKRDLALAKAQQTAARLQLAALAKQQPKQSFWAEMMHAAAAGAMSVLGGRRF